MTRPRTLVVVRHAKSSWKTNDPDLHRPLSPRGSRDAVVAGQQLAGLAVDVALLSPATRAQQTWQCLRMGGVACGDVRTSEVLYHGWTDDVVALIRSLPAAARTVLVVGHEPTMSDLVLTLSMTSAHTAAVNHKFPTAAIAVLTHDGDWDDLADGTAELVAFEVPRG